MCIGTVYFNLLISGTYCPFFLYKAVFMLRCFYLDYGHLHFSLIKSLTFFLWALEASDDDTA